MMLGDRARTFMIERGGLLALMTAAIYIVVTPDHVVDGDNAEFATLSVTGGVAHPPGYPLYVLWLRVMSWLPGTSPASASAISTALLGAGAVFALYHACRAWGAGAPAATLAVGIFASGPVVVRVSTEAEVFALNHLVVPCVLWLSARHGHVRGGRRALGLGLVAGLGLSNHLTCVLVAPVGLLGIARAVQEMRAHVSIRRAAISAVALAILGLVVGLAPYGYLLVAPDSAMSWGTVDGLEGIVHMFLRMDYGGPTAFRVAPVEVPATANLAALARTLGRGWLWLPGLAGLAALAIAAMQRSVASRESRAGWGCLAAAWLLAGPLLVMRFNVPPTGLGLYVNQRFHLLPMLLLAIPVALALDRIPVRRASQLITGLVASIGVVGLTAFSLPYVSRVHTAAVEVSAKNLLGSLPRDAVLIHGQDEFHAVTGYVQTALGQRPDVVVVTWPLMQLSWYRARLAARGVNVTPGIATPVRLVSDLLTQGRPVFVDRLQREVIASFRTHPYGVVIRVVPLGEPMPSVLEVYRMNEELYATFAFDYPRPGMHDEFATEVHSRYAAIWTMIATMLRHQGHAHEAARALELAERFAPRSD